MLERWIGGFLDSWIDGWLIRVISIRKSLVCNYLHLREPLVAVRRGAVKHHGFYYIRNVRSKICRERGRVGRMPAERVKRLNG